MTVIASFFFYLMEIIACFLFFENVGSRKKESSLRNYRVPVSYVAVFAVNFTVYFFNIQYLNLAVFALGLLFISFFCYEIKKKAAFFFSLMLTVFMIVSELIVVSFFTVFLHEELPPVQDNMLVWVIQGGMSKLIYFLLVFVCAKVFAGKEHLQETDKFLFALTLLPLATVLVLNFLFYYELHCGFEEPYKIGLTVSAVGLLIANIVVFAVYDFVQRSNSEKLFLQTENERNRARIAYYEFITSQYEDRNILIHDIKRHLYSLEAVAKNSGNEAVVRYIDSIRDDFNLEQTNLFSGNRLLDVILNRYSLICRQNGIRFSAEIGNIPTGAVSETDLTALFDNLLENAVEGTRSCADPFVRLTVQNSNDHFLFLQIINSCNGSPVFDKKGMPKSKKNGKQHGWGVKSIQKVIDKHDGELKFVYHESENSFETQCVIKL